MGYALISVRIHSFIHSTPSHFLSVTPATVIAAALEDIRGSLALIEKRLPVTQDTA
jgi:hypothetical protein